jgi:hypothetical protein
MAESRAAPGIPPPATRSAGRRPRDRGGQNREDGWDIPPRTRILLPPVGRLLKNINHGARVVRLLVVQMRRRFQGFFSQHGEWSLMAVAWAIAFWLLVTPVMTYPFRVNWDETFYLAQATSIAFDLDYDIANDLFSTNLPAWSPKGEHPASIAFQLHHGLDGRIQSHFPIGSALVWMPAMIVIRLAGPESGAATYAQAKIVPRFDGRSRLWLSLWSALLGAVTVWGGHILVRRLGFTRRAAAVAATVAFVLTPLAFWTFRSPGHSHLASAVAVTGLGLAAVAYHRRPSVTGATWIGLTGGLVYVVRWADACYLVLGLAAWIGVAWREWRSSRTALRRAGIHAVTGLAGFSALALFQWTFWKLSLGHWLTVPQGENFVHWGAPLWAILLWRSDNAFVQWTPAAWIAVPGLLLWVRRRPAVALVAVLSGVSAVYLAAVAADPQGGWSFGSRRLTSLYPVVAAGVAEFVRVTHLERSRWLCFAVVLLSVFSGIFMIRLRETGITDLVAGLHDQGLWLGGRTGEALELTIRSDLLQAVREAWDSERAMMLAAAVLFSELVLITAFVWVARWMRKGRRLAALFILIILGGLLALHLVMIGTNGRDDTGARSKLVHMRDAARSADWSRARALHADLLDTPRFLLQASLMAANEATRQGRFDLASEILAVALERVAPGSFPTLERAANEFQHRRALETLAAKSSRHTGAEHRARPFSDVSSPGVTRESPTSPPPTGVFNVTVNKKDFRSGDTLILTARVSPEVIPRAVDVYVGVLLPDGGLLFLEADRSLTRENQPLFTGLTMVPFEREIFRYTFRGGEPEGEYSWLAAVTEAHTATVVGETGRVPFNFRR